MTPAQQGAALAAWADRLGIREAMWIGHSMGCNTVAHVAAMQSRPVNQIGSAGQASSLRRPPASILEKAVKVLRAVGFLAAAYGRINSTWTLPNQVGWPIAKELLFTARVVEAEEAYRIGLLNHLVPRAQLRAKTMDLARQIAANDRASVIGIKALLLKQMAQRQHALPRRPADPVKTRSAPPAQKAPN